MDLPGGELAYRSSQHGRRCGAVEEIRRRYCRRVRARSEGMPYLADHDHGLYVGACLEALYPLRQQTGAGGRDGGVDDGCEVPWRLPKGLLRLQAVVRPMGCVLLLTRTLDDRWVKGMTAAGDGDDGGGGAGSAACISSHLQRRTVATDSCDTRRLRYSRSLYSSLRYRLTLKTRLY